jgi:hypothetical protein
MTQIRLALATAALGLAVAAAGVAQGQSLYQCSGIGLEERAAADTVPQNVRLIFAQKDGHYLGGVETRITDAAGNEVLSVRCPGPWVLLNLPEGQYQITVELDDVTQTRKIAVPASGTLQKQVFRF